MQCRYLAERLGEWFLNAGAEAVARQVEQTQGQVDEEAGEELCDLCVPQPVVV